MLHLLFAADEPSKVPFYIAGGVLAAWAVAVSAVGLTSPRFPFNSRGQAGVILVTAVLVVLAIAMAIATSK